MLFLDETLATVEENLALDEVLLLDADAGMQSSEVLRIWHAKQPFIVLGRSSRVDAEVERCLAEQAGIPVIRRCSGGATILAAPGCMFYAVLLSLNQRPHLRMLDEAHRLVMSKLLQAIQPLQPSVNLDGTCDIVLEGQKVSGNSLRVGRRWLLYHGTLLRDMDLSMIAKYLKHPPREPEYRNGRNHTAFVRNLRVERDALRSGLQKVWNAHQPLDMAYMQRARENVSRLVAEKYTQRAWNDLR